MTEKERDDLLLALCLSVATANGDAGLAALARRVLEPRTVPDCSTDPAVAVAMRG